MGTIAGLKSMLEHMNDHPGDRGRVLLIHAGKNNKDHFHFQKWAIDNAGTMYMAAVTHNSGTPKEKDGSKPPGAIRGTSLQLQPPELEQHVQELLTDLEQLLKRTLQFEKVGDKFSLYGFDITEVMTVLAALREHVRSQTGRVLHIVIATGCMGDRGTSYRPVRGEQCPCSLSSSHTLRSA
jgi:hypothetical protein